MDQHKAPINTLGAVQMAKPRIPDCTDAIVEDIKEATKSEKYQLKKDEGKVTWRLIPFLAIEQIAKVMMYGAKKHSPGGWAKGTYEDAREEYFDAAYRHLVIEWWEKGITLDPATGLPHLAHAGCNVMFLIWYELKYKLKSIPKGNDSSQDGNDGG